MDKRKCGSCTKCCEGYLTGQALGHSFFSGKPCHFVAIGTGCTVYSKRPQNPCIDYKCDWLTNLDIPEWLKPEISNVIIDTRIHKGHTYINLREAGNVVSSRVLNWFIQYVLKNQLNAVWQIEGGNYWMGNPDFVNAMELLQKKPQESTKY
jgi:hypothetical protein